MTTPQQNTPELPGAIVALGPPSPRRPRKAKAEAKHHADFLDLPGLESEEVDPGDYVIHVKAKQVGVPTYPNCACPVKEVKAHTPFIMEGVLDEPHARKSVVIDIERRRWMCKGCGKTVTQPLDCLAEGRYRMTRRLLEYIQPWSLLGTELSLSEETGVFVRTIRDIRKKFVERLEAEVEFDTPRVLGLDGVRADYRQRRVILTDIEGGFVLDLLEAGNSEAIADGIRLLPGWEDIGIFTIDMDKTLKKAVLEARPEAVIVIDPFHVVKMANEVMDAVRNRLYPRAKEKREPGQSRPRPEPFRRRSAELLKKDSKGKVLKGKYPKHVERWFDDGEKGAELRLAYELKEEFMALFDKETYTGALLMRKDAASRFYEKWEEKLNALKLPENKALLLDFQKIRTAITNWGEYVFNYFDPGHRYTNAFTESMNRKVRDILRDARGCDFETVRARIVYGVYLMKRLRAGRALEMEAVRPRPKGRPGSRQWQKSKGAKDGQKSKGKSAPGGKRDGGARRSVRPDSRQVVLRFPEPEQGESGACAQEEGLVA